MNAVMNCSFLQSSHIQVSLFDDRLEVTSPGGLMPGVTISRMKEGYSQIRNRALANAFAYMNLIEGWGTGIPRLMRGMEAYGLEQPEFVEMEEALRINLRRMKVPDNAGSMPDAGGTASDNAGSVPDTDKSVPDNGGIGTERRMSAQQMCIYEAVLRKGSITSADASVLLNVGGRRSRDILKEMTDSGILKKKGPARNTVYVRNDGGC